MQLPRAAPTNESEAAALAGLVAHASLHIMEHHVMDTAPHIQHLFGVSLAIAHTIHTAIASIGAMTVAHGLYHMIQELSNATDLDELTLEDLGVAEQRTALCDDPVAHGNRRVADMAEATASSILQQYLQDDFFALASADSAGAQRVVYLTMLGLRAAFLHGLQKELEDAYLRCTLALLMKAHIPMGMHSLHAAGATDEENVRMDLVHSNVAGYILGDRDGNGCCSWREKVLRPFISTSEDTCGNVLQEIDCDVRRGTFHRDAICAANRCVTPYGGGPLLQVVFDYVSRLT